MRMAVSCLCWLRRLVTRREVGADVECWFAGVQCHSLRMAVSCLGRLLWLFEGL